MAQSLANMAPALKDAYLGQRALTKRKHAKPPAVGYTRLKKRLKERLAEQRRQISER